MRDRPTKDGYHSRAARKETLHTLSLIEPHLRPTDVILDIGCGSGYVAWQLARRRAAPVLAIDIQDCRKKVTPHFALYDGITLPFEDDSCDIILLAFVLHHIPNEAKPAAIKEARRVSRRTVVVLEDTPRNFIDRWFNRRHGRKFRESIGSAAAYGFNARLEWNSFFARHRFVVRESVALGRFSRDWEQPFARSCFVLDKGDISPGHAE